MNHNKTKYEVWDRIVRREDIAQGVTVFWNKL